MMMTVVSGILTEYGHELPVRVYFEDTDFTGIVYHARYVQFFERGRSDFLRLKGFNHIALEEGQLGEPLFFVVKNLALDFHGSAKIDDLLTIQTKIEEMRGARLIMAQKALLAGEKLVSGRVTVVLVDGRGKPKRLPQKLLHSFLT